MDPASISAVVTRPTPGQAGISSGMTLVILSKCGGVFEEARRALARIGCDALLLKEKTVQHRNVSYTITLIKTLHGKKQENEVVRAYGR